MQPLDDVIRIFIGFDEVEEVAYHTLCSSIIEHTSVPVQIMPLRKGMLVPYHRRPREVEQSNEFTYTRFLTPFLSGYEGWSLFMDSDMLLTEGLEHLWDMRDDGKAVMVVKHDYTPRDNKKFLGQVQHVYPRKNWSSLMLFNNARCRILTPQYVEKASGRELHQFLWARDDEIGSLPVTWNYLVGEYSGGMDVTPANLHYTVGGPYFWEYAGCEYAGEWLRQYMHRMTHAKQRE